MSATAGRTTRKKRNIAIIGKKTIKTMTRFQRTQRLSRWRVLRDPEPVILPINVTQSGLSPWGPLVCTRGTSIVGHPITSNCLILIVAEILLAAHYLQQVHGRD
jgi:hypothetical protein